MPLPISQESGPQARKKTYLHNSLFHGESTTHLRVGSYFLSLAKEENYSIHFILPLYFTLLNFIKHLGH